MTGPRVMRLASSIALAIVVGGCGSGGGSAHSATSVAAATSATGATTTVAPTSSVSPAIPTGPVRTAPANLATGPALVLDASGQGSFFDVPFPSDARLTASGSLDLADYPNPKGKKFVREAILAATTDTRGASPTGTIYFRFDAPVNVPLDDPAASVLPGSSVLVVDIDPASPARLERRPIHVTLTLKQDSVRPANLLQVQPVPGRGLRPNTRYAAIVLRSLGAPGAAYLGQTPALTELLAGRAPAGSRGATLQAAYAPLAAALKDLNLHPDDLAAATVFTTGDPTESLVKQVEHVNRLPAPKPVDPIAIRDRYPGFTALEGVWSAPQYQQGVPPFIFGGGRQAVDAQGLPIAQRYERSQFQISVPKGKMPARGWPLYFWVHGTGGDASNVIDRGRRPAPDVQPPPGSGIASYAAPRGWATSCTALPLSPTRIGKFSFDGYMAYNFFNPVAMRDNFKQMILELVQFRKLMLELRIDPALCPGCDASAAPDGKVRFDPDTLVVGGQSQGSYLAGMLSALLPDWKGVILTGAGGSWVEFPFGPLDPVKPANVIDLVSLPLGEKLDRQHPYVTIFDLAVGPADNTHYLQKTLRSPLPGHAVPHVLAVEGHGDLQVPENLQRALVLALGLDLAGPEVPGFPADEQVLPVLPWGGLKPLAYPVSGNRLLPNGQTRTAVFVRYERDFREGHFVSFQLDEPKRQIGEFLSAISAGQVPTIR